MTYTYGLHGAPAVGGGLPGLPQRVAAEAKSELLEVGYGSMNSSADNFLTYAQVGRGFPFVGAGVSTTNLRTRKNYVLGGTIAIDENFGRLAIANMKTGNQILHVEMFSGDTLVWAKDVSFSQTISVLSIQVLDNGGAALTYSYSSTSSGVIVLSPSGEILFNRHHSSSNLIASKILAIGGGVLACITENTTQKIRRLCCLSNSGAELFTVPYAAYHGIFNPKDYDLVYHKELKKSYIVGNLSSATAVGIIDSASGAITYKSTSYSTGLPTSMKEYQSCCIVGTDLYILMSSTKSASSSVNRAVFKFNLLTELFEQSYYLISSGICHLSETINFMRDEAKLPYADPSSIRMFRPEKVYVSGLLELNPVLPVGLPVTFFNPVTATTVPGTNGAAVAWSTPTAAPTVATAETGVTIHALTQSDSDANIYYRENNLGFRVLKANND